MPKPAYGELGDTIDAGKYDAVIYLIADIGHQQTLNGKSIHKYFFEFDIPEKNTTKALSNFGIANWLSPSKAPYVGLYELITAVAKVPVTKEEIAVFDLWTLIGKTVKITIEEDEKGYMNVTAIEPAETDLKSERELFTFEIDDIPNLEKLGQLESKCSRALTQLYKSEEFINQSYKKDEGEEKEEIKIEDVPF